MPRWAACICRKKIWRSSDCRPQELLATPDPARFRPLLALEADRARELYQAGDQLIPYISEDSQPALWVLVNIYRELLEKIAERQYDVFSGKVSLTVSEKLRILGKASCSASPDILQRVCHSERHAISPVHACGASGKWRGRVRQGDCCSRSVTANADQEC